MPEKYERIYKKANEQSVETANLVDRPFYKNIFFILFNSILTRWNSVNGEIHLDLALDFWEQRGFHCGSI